MLVAAAELVFLMVLPLLLPAFGMWPEHVAVGDARTARLWQLALFVALLLIGPLHMVVYARLVKRHRATTLTLSKRSPYLVVRDRLGERQIPATECLLYAALDPASDGSEFGTATPMAIFLSHKGRPLAQWVLDYRRASDSEAKALSAGMREYLRGGDRPVSRRHE